MQHIELADFQQVQLRVGIRFDKPLPNGVRLA